MTAVLIVLLISLAVLFLLSKDKYREFIEPVDKKRYPLKQLIPVGLYLLELFKYRYGTGYDRKLLVKVSEISGNRNARYYLKIHMANKIVFLLLALVLISAVGIRSELNAGFLVFSAALLAALFYLTDNELSGKIKNRRMLIRMDFPDFLNKLTLLINAGMTVTRAWEKITSDSRKNTPFYEELRAALMDIKSGKPEQLAYEEFAKRCRTPEITRFTSVIIQNLRKGNAEIISILRLQANDCWEMRKSTARKLGEEASTKMILPLGIMLVAILIIVAVPAILSLKGISQ